MGHQMKIKGKKEAKENIKRVVLAQVYEMIPKEITGQQKSLLTRTQGNRKKPEW